MSGQCKNCEGKGIVTYGVFACFGSQECHICKGSGKDLSMISIKYTEYKKLTNSIKALEAENQSAWNACDAAETRANKAEATIQRMRELPQQWRDISYKTTEEYTNLHGCADQLDAALEQSDE